MCVNNSKHDSYEPTVCVRWGATSSLLPILRWDLHTQLGVYEKKSTYFLLLGTKKAEINQDS